MGLRFIRELEQGKKTIRMDKVEQVLGLFDSKLNPGKSEIDPFDIFWNYFNMPIVLETFEGQTRYGFILEEHYDQATNRIVDWSFLPNNLAKKYKESEDENLLTRISHASIRSIRFQNYVG